MNIQPQGQSQHVIGIVSIVDTIVVDLKLRIVSNEYSFVTLRSLNSSNKGLIIIILNKVFND